MLTVYFPLTAVYGFHQPAETWILRRYSSTMTVDVDGEPRTGAWAESSCPIFRDPRAQVASPDERGQIDVQRCVVYTQVKLRALDASSGTPRPLDVLFDAQGVTGQPGSAWVVQEVRGWRDALGWEAVLTRQGQRGVPPWV
jgi:hypothetical protein